MNELTRDNRFHESEIKTLKYDLSKFGLTEQQIKDDCNAYYKTFIN